MGSKYLPLDVPDEFRALEEKLRAGEQKMRCYCCGEFYWRGQLRSHLCFGGDPTPRDWVWCPLDIKDGVKQPPREGACGRCPIHCHCAWRKQAHGNLPRPYAKESTQDFLVRFRKALESRQRVRGGGDAPMVEEPVDPVDR